MPSSSSSSSSNAHNNPAPNTSNYTDQSLQQTIVNPSKRRFPRYYNFFISHTFGKPINVAPGFFQRILLRLPARSRYLLLTIVAAGSLGGIAVGADRGDIFPAVRSLSPFQFFRFRNYHKRQYAFTENLSMPYPYASEDDEDGEVFSEEWMKYWYDKQQERGMDELERIDWKENREITRENFIMHAVYLEMYGLEYDNVYDMFHRGEIGDPLEELKMVPVDRRRVFDHGGGWIPPPLPGELRYPPVPEWGRYSLEKQREINTRAKQFVVSEDLVFGSHDLQSQYSLLEKRDLLERYQKRLWEQCDIQLPSDYHRQVNLENRPKRFSGTYRQDGSRVRWPNWKKRPLLNSFDVFG